MTVRSWWHWVGIASLSLVLSGCRQARWTDTSAASDSTEDAYQSSVAGLLCPGATRSFQVTAAGDLFNGAWLVRVEPRAEGVIAGRPHRISYEDRWCPVVRWTRSSGTTRWEFEA